MEQTALTIDKDAEFIASLPKVKLLKAFDRWVWSTPNGIEKHTYSSQRLALNAKQPIQMSDDGLQICVTINGQLHHVTNAK